MQNLIIYSPFKSAKLDYTIAFIFSKVQDVNIVIENSKENFISATNYLKVNYGYENISGSLNICNSNYFKNFQLTLVPDFEEELNFINGTSAFDIFAATFFLLGRVEEYTTHEKDKHGRFPITQNSLFKKQIHRKPVIDLWIKKLLIQLNLEFDNQLNLNSNYSFLSTTDIDHIFAFREKPLWIQMGSLIKDLVRLKFNRVSDRFKSRDPYDRLDEMIRWNSKLGIQLKAFALCAPRSEFDKSLSPDNPVFTTKLKSLAEKIQIGIHPSYQSDINSEKIKAEKNQLEIILGKNIKISRQHFLKLRFPETYKALIQNNISEDYTMGFAEDIGFRAGTSKPFYWYDIETDEVTNLKVFPFQVMDVSLKQYLKLSPADAVTLVKEIVAEIKDVQGQFGLIWHNSSFYEAEGWGGWEKAYRAILSLAQD